jgi:endonuclease-8
VPEGDTVHKVAAVITRELDGEILRSCLIRGVYGSERLAGARVVEVEPLGKHLLVHLDRDVQIRVHLGMNGSWHRYPVGAKWKRSRYHAAVVLETATTVLVCFDPMEVEMIPTPQRHWHRQLENLGPDLLARAEPDWPSLYARCRELHPPQDFLGEVLLDQRVAAGLGNVYKSEVPFMGPLREGPPGQGEAFAFAERGYSPWAPWGALPRQDLLSMFRRGRELLLANLGGWFRTTRVDRRVSPAPKGGDLYVYGRAEEECYRCGGEIARAHQGLQSRVTYWCPACQLSPGSAGSASVTNKG